MSALLGLFSCSALGGMSTLWEHGAGLAGLLGYIGPGAGLSMMGALAAVACVILLALLGPLLIPIRLVYSLLRRRRERIAKEAAPPSSHPAEPVTASAELCCSFGDREAPT